MHDRISFLCNGEARVIDGPATRTVLEWLRTEAGLLGTKEGCAEGDCGACTVILAEPDGISVRQRPVNACILFVPALHGRHLLTVEHLARDGVLHPVQRAMVAHHASQCGFCTPGFVMSLYALQQQPAPPDRAEIVEALAGNLCRCTGYRPIVDAALDCVGPAGGPEATLPLPPLADAALHRPDYDAPTSLTEALRLRAARPEALLLAGGTDIALRVTKQRERLPPILALDRVAALRDIAVTEEHVRVGAGVAYQDALPVLAAEWPEFGGLLRRLGSRQIRHRGTIGGNLGTASPIGDCAPVLIALGAQVVVASLRGERRIACEAFFVGYRRTALAADEIIVRVEIPRAEPGDVVRVYKVSKRAEEDISAVCAAFRLRLRDGQAVALRAGFGGLAATPLRLPAVEAAACGPWDEAAVRRAQAALDAAIAPIDDARASAAYRRRVAGNLLRRLLLETQGVRARLRSLAA